MTPPPSSSSSSQRQPDLSEQRLTADYTLRNLQQQLVAVTGQADLKASIVITASSITLSLAISRVNDERLRPGVITLAAFVLTALVFAVFAVLPKYRLKAARQRVSSIRSSSGMPRSWSSRSTTG